jgi:hypothetical protein
MRVKPSLNSCATSSAIDINPPRRARLSVIYKVIILLTKLVDPNRANATYTPSLDTHSIAGGIHAIVRKRPPYDDNSLVRDGPISHRLEEYAEHCWTKRSIVCLKLQRYGSGALNSN